MPNMCDNSLTVTGSEVHLRAVEIMTWTEWRMEFKVGQLIHFEENELDIPEEVSKHILTKNNEVSRDVLALDNSITPHRDAPTSATAEEDGPSLQTIFEKYFDNSSDHTSI